MLKSTTSESNSEMTQFKTKIVQRFKDGFEFFELLLPDGRRVASGSLSHCWDEREQWEESLKAEKHLQLQLDFH